MKAKPKEVERDTGEIVEIHSAPIVATAQVGAIAFRSPEDMIEGVTVRAKLLADIINKQKLYSTIRNKKYVHVEGWTTMGAMIGVTPAEESVTELEDGGFIATVKLIRIQDGVVIGRGSAECGSDEPTWMNRPRYARRSMAITRATGKAFRLGYSWIMIMAGYAPTPLEEIPPDDDTNPEPVAKPQPPAEPIKATDEQMSQISSLYAEKELTESQKNSTMTFQSNAVLQTGENADKLISILSKRPTKKEIDAHRTELMAKAKEDLLAMATQLLGEHFGDAVEVGDQWLNKLVAAKEIPSTDLTTANKAQLTNVILELEKRKKT